MSGGVDPGLPTGHRLTRVRRRNTAQELTDGRPVGCDAVEQFRQLGAKFVLLDLVMPERSGLAALAEIRVSSSSLRDSAIS